MTEEIQKPRKEEAKAVSTYLRISPRKMRVVIDTIRHKPVGRAEVILMSLNRKAARFVTKVLKSAKANAKVLGMDENKLYVSEIRADGGPMFKRFQARAQGRADRILKRTTHLSMTLKEAARAWGGSALPEVKDEEKKGKPKGGKSKIKGKKAAKAAS